MVFCEGEASEPDYIKGLKRLPQVRANTALDIEIDPGVGVPLVLVNRAIDRLSRDDEVDECWCVFDVESPRPHPHLAKAMRLAEDRGVRLAVSNPCFELWLILHFEERSAFLTTAAAERRSRQLDGRKGKRVDASLYLPRRHEALGRAESLGRRHSDNETRFPNDNPSSSVGALLTAIEPT